MDKTPTYQLRLIALKKAVDSFEKALAIRLDSMNDTEKDAIRNGQALKFGFSVEFLWKTIKDFLFEVHGIECNSPKSCLKSFFQNSDLTETDYQNLMVMINYRNELSHMYDQRTFEKIWNSLPSHQELILKCISEIERGI
jgi:nucleotidyltransferase substrate binding protein (TIGR01987 family)